jgi:hypothetical protein
MIVRPLHLELVALWWHRRWDSVVALVERALCLHWMGVSVSIGLLSREL